MNATDERLEILLTKAEKEALRDQSIRDGRSMAGTIRHALRVYIAAEELRREAKRLEMRIP